MDGNAHTVYFVATDPYGNTGTESFNFTYIEQDLTAPSFNFTSTVTGITDLPITFAGSATDNETTISSVQYSLDGAERQWIFPIAETSTNNVKNFSVEFSDLTDGEHTLVFYATNELELETTSSTYTFTVDTTAPTCTASWTNKASPYYSKSFTYTNVTCTDAVGITDAAFRVYHIVQGELEAYADNHLPAPNDSSYGGTSESFTFTVDLTSLGNIDGITNIEFKTWDAAGNVSYDLDPVVMESTDSTNPSVHLDEVLPDGLTDTTPTITGSCTDDTYRDTNSFISSLEYKIDDGSFELISLLDEGEYNDSYTENYSVELASLAAGSHTVTVRCTDASTRVSTTSDTFSIESPVDPVPGEFTFSEAFDDYDNMDIPGSSNVIWGNGKLRLKETISTSLSVIHSADKCSRYADDCRGDWGVKPDPADANVVWYMQGGKFFTYNTQTAVNTQFDYPTQYSISALSGQINGWEIGIHNGKKYFVAGDDYSMVIINITDGVGYRNTSFGIAFYSFELDFDRGQMGAYVVVTANGGNSSLAYLNFSDTTDPVDDILTRVPLSKINSTSLFVPFLDESQNAVYIGASSDGIYKFNDNDVPSDTASYVVTKYDGYSEVYDHMLLDDTGRLIFGTSTNSNGKVYVVLDDNDTPFNAADDTIQELSQPIQLGYKDVRGLQYIQGQNGVGDQLFIATSEDNPVYLNFNDTYTNLIDDTFIELPTDNGIRPSGSNIYVTDYNTMYANNPRQGFYKVTLTRGWVSSGQAVALPTRPSQQLIVDNFVANANVAGTIALGDTPTQSYLARAMDRLTPDVYAAGEDGVQYFVSTDGGVTWSQVSLNELQQLQQEDYRIKFKIVLSPSGGATPVLDSYSLSYAGYPTLSDVTTVEDLTVSSSTTATTTDTSFSLTVSGVDTLGYKVPTYSGSITLSLIDTSNNAVVSGLNQSAMSVTAGSSTLTGVAISRSGSYKIRVTDGTFTTDSATITITDSASSLPSTSVNFSADSYTITKGQSTRLHYSGNNVKSFVLKPGDIALSGTSGSYTVSPQTTTRYELVGTGDYGSASNTITIVVVECGTDCDTTDDASVVGSVGESAEPIITLTPNSTILKGQRATITWSVTGADEVSIDYLPYAVSTSGSFDFYPEKTTTITLTARKGNLETTKQTTVTVVDVPLPIQQIARDIQQNSPLLGAFITAVVQGAQIIPRSALMLLVAAQASISTLLVISVVAQGAGNPLNGQTLASIFRAAGFLPFRKRQGFVHQTKTGKPIPFAIITIFDAAHKQLGTLVSDVFGSYQEPYLSPGEYQMEVSHAEFNFPTKYARPPHLTMNDFYKGEMLRVRSSRLPQAIMFPLDAQNLVWNLKVFRYRLALLLSRVLVALQWTLYPLSALALLASITHPNLWNIATAILYGILLVLKLKERLTLPTVHGTVSLMTENKGIGNVSVLLNQENGVLVALTKTDAGGNFSFYVKPGTYAIQVLSDSYRWVEGESLALNTIKVAETGTATAVEFHLQTHSLLSPDNELGD
ncbi:carboxypeptidase regulatory-like domain-containing protein [Candidatus Woesebacteria bacterium]|nr:carboxypeptidase regulatory-like domain-containing protein [Candidatus Woesebacteria bacterium]